VGTDWWARGLAFISLAVEAAAGSIAYLAYRRSSGRISVQAYNTTHTNSSDDFQTLTDVDITYIKIVSHFRPLSVDSIKFEIVGKSVNHAWRTVMPGDVFAKHRLNELGEKELAEMGLVGPSLPCPLEPGITTVFSYRILAGEELWTHPRNAEGHLLQVPLRAHVRFSNGKVISREFYGKVMEQVREATPYDPEHHARYIAELRRRNGEDC
jgi:hypothetical protein